MKKAFILLVALVFTYGSQAQIGNLIGKAIKNKVEQSVNAAVNQQQPQQAEAEQKEADENDVPTPEEVMAMVPQIPAPQQIAEYVCEQNRANPRTLKMLTNPTTTFLSQMVVASASGYVSMMGKAQGGYLYNFDEQLLNEFGISQEKYDAMSEEEQQELATKYASELQERFLRTAERLSADEGYNKLMSQYSDIESEIERVYAEADSLCQELWKKTGGAKASPSEADMCEYFKQAVPLQYNAVLGAMKVRKTRQLDVAKEIDRYVQTLAKEMPNEVYAGFYNQGGICATSYVGDAMRLTSISDPR